MNNCSQCGKKCVLGHNAVYVDIDTIECDECSGNRRCSYCQSLVDERGYCVFHGYTRESLLPSYLDQR